MTVWNTVRNSIENPSYPLTDTTLLDFLGIEKTASGKRVNEVTALGSAAVWRAVNVKASVPSALPFHAYRSDGEARVQVTSGQAARIMEDPHPDMTKFEFWQLARVYRLLWGNAYIRKLRNPLDQVAELWPIHPARVKAGRESETGRKVYAIDGGKEVLSDREILHLPGLGYDGICGCSPIRAARQSIGLGLAAEEYGAKLFGNGSLASGILQTEQRLTNDQADALSRRWKAKRTGLESAHDTIILDRGAKFQQLTIPPEDAQFLETRRFQIAEICRWFGIPPFLMFETEKSTSWGTGLEQQAIGWVRIDLLPDLVAVEQRVTKHVLKPQPVYAHHVVEGLLRGDSAARAALYKAMWEIGVYSTDDIRAKEEEAPVEGGATRWRPMNFEPLTSTEPTPAPAPAPAPEPAPADTSQPLRPVASVDLFLKEIFADA